MKENLITIDELRKRIPQSRSTVYERVKKGILPPFRYAGSKPYFREQQIDRFIETGDWRLAKN